MTADNAASVNLPVWTDEDAMVRFPYLVSPLRCAATGGHEWVQRVATQEPLCEPWVACVKCGWERDDDRR